MNGKSREEADAILKGYNPTVTSGNYTKYRFADKSEIWIGPDGVIDRIPKPTYNPDGSRVLGFRIDPTSGNLARAHTFLEEILNK